jgi:3-phenylpropionate/cinnamic acid dioxygenase small subunit
VDATESTGAASDSMLREAEQLLFREARLLDDHRLDEWLDLFTEDATYWVPLERGQKDPRNTSSIIFDDRILLEIRVRQSRQPRAHARLPLARTCHQVGNVMLLDAGAGEARVGSSLVLIEYRKERQRVFGASVEHRLRRTPAGLRIAAKRVDLVNSEAELDGIAFLL